KLIAVTTTPHELYPHHDHVLRVLTRALETRAWGVPAQLLVRLHPRDDRTYYAAFEGLPDVIIEKPFRETVRAGDGMATAIATGAGASWSSSASSSTAAPRNASDRSSCPSSRRRRAVRSINHHHVWNCRLRLADRRARAR